MEQDKSTCQQPCNDAIRAVRVRRADLGRSAVRSGHVRGLGAAVITVFDVELHSLSLRERPEAIGDDAGLQGQP